MQKFEEISPSALMKLIDDMENLIVTEKHDGCHIILKVDKDGFCFSRNRKKYDQNIEKIFPKLSLYHIPFFCMEKIVRHALFFHLEEGIYEIEILFGKYPNVIRNSKNRIVILHKIEKDGKKTYCKGLNLQNPPLIIEDKTSFSTNDVWEIDYNYPLEMKFDSLLKNRIKNFLLKRNDETNMFNIDILTSRKKQIMNEKQKLLAKYRKFVKLFENEFIKRYLPHDEEVEGLVIYSPSLDRFFKITLPIFKSRHYYFHRYVKNRNVDYIRRIIHKTKYEKRKILLYDRPIRHLIIPFLAINTKNKEYSHEKTDRRR